MRYLDINCLQSMSSPIRYVMKNIHNAIINIAPERTKQFETELDEFTLTYLDVGKWIVNVNTQEKHIRISRQVVEIMWAASYAYMVFYDRICAGKLIKAKEDVDLTSQSDVKIALQLLQWAYNNFIDINRDIPWPIDLPKPIENPGSESIEKIADELCLCATAAILHHEFSHIRLKHVRNLDNVDAEREADYEMVDWILHPSLNNKDMMFIKRSLGIAIAFEVMTAYGIYTSNFGGDSHPYTYERLIRSLERHITDDNHIVWAIIVGTLKLHLDHKGIPTPGIAYNSFKECVNSYANILSRFTNSK